jgi:hypothetical protein
MEKREKCKFGLKHVDKGKLYTLIAQIIFFGIKSGIDTTGIDWKGFRIDDDTER